MSESFGGSEFVVGSVRGIRGFHVDKMTGGLRPVASFGYRWKASENVARCDVRGSIAYGRPSHRDGHIASPHCSCGFYAYYRKAGEAAQVGEVKGIIEGYGNVTLGTKGFRCEKARIVALQVPTPLLRLYRVMAVFYALLLVSGTLAVVTMPDRLLNWLFLLIDMSCAAVYLTFAPHGSKGDYKWVKYVREAYPGIPVYRSMFLMKMHHLWPYRWQMWSLLNGADET